MCTCVCVIYNVQLIYKKYLGWTNIYYKSVLAMETGNSGFLLFTKETPKSLLGDNHSLSEECLTFSYV